MSKAPRPMRVTVLGAGSWGTTLALHLHGLGHRVTLWEKIVAHAERLRRDRENKTYLPGIPLPEGLAITTSLEEAAASAEMIVVAIPSEHVRATAGALGPHIRGRPLLTSATKGLDVQTLERMSEVLAAEIPSAARRGPIALSGPSHAEEVSRHLPTTLVAASPDLEAAREVQAVLMSSTLRVYTNPDILGVELGGALKNGIAIASGICAGLGYGDNTTGALLTRGMAEISRLGVALGAKPETFSGLSGIGDLITTCISRHSRNRHVGVELGRGRPLGEILAEMVQVAEGVPTTRASRQLALLHRVEMPITMEVHAVLFEGRDPRQAVDSLMLREPKAEW